MCVCVYVLLEVHLTDSISCWWRVHPECCPIHHVNGDLFLERVTPDSPKFCYTTVRAVFNGVNVLFSICYVFFVAHAFTFLCSFNQQFCQTSGP